MPHNQQILDAIDKNEYHTVRGLLTHDELLATQAAEEAEVELPAADAQKARPINAQNEKGETYFHVAVRKLLKPGAPYELNVLEELLKLGIDTSIRDYSGQDNRGRTALEGVDLDYCWSDQDSPTLLIRVITASLPHLFKLLINSSADIDKTEKRGNSPVCECVFSGQPEMLQQLIDKGANIFVGHGRYNPIEMALYTKSKPMLSDTQRCLKNLPQCISILLKNGAGLGVDLRSYRYGIADMPFNGTLLLGAIIDNHIKQLNPSFKKAIFSVNKYATKFPSYEEVKKIREYCNKIMTDCLKQQADRDKYDRVSKIILALDAKFPGLNAVPVSAPTQEKQDAKTPVSKASLQSEKKETGLLASLRSRFFHTPTLPTTSPQEANEIPLLPPDKRPNQDKRK